MPEIGIVVVTVPKHACSGTILQMKELTAAVEVALAVDIAEIVVVKVVVLIAIVLADTAAARMDYCLWMLATDQSAAERIVELLMRH